MDSGDEVQIGCTACVRQPLQSSELLTVDLKCNITEGTRPVSYLWGRTEGNNTELIQEGVDGPINFAVPAPGSYSCMVENLDGDDIEMSDLFGKKHLV